MAEPRHYRILLLGDAGAGKTTFLTNFHSDELDPEYIPTTGYQTHCLHFETSDGTKFVYDVYDTSGQEFFREGYDKKYFSDVDGVIIMIDLSQEYPFGNLHVWISKAREFCPSSHIVICGNKQDRTALIPFKSLYTYSRHYPYVIISAFMDHNVIAPFKILSRYIVYNEDITLSKHVSVPQMTMNDLKEKIQEARKEGEKQREKNKKDKQKKFADYIWPTVMQSMGKILDNYRNASSSVDAFRMDMSQEWNDAYSRFCKSNNIDDSNQSIYGNGIWIFVMKNDKNGYTLSVSD